MVAVEYLKVFQFMLATASFDRKFECYMKDQPASDASILTHVLILMQFTDLIYWPR